MLLIIHIWNKVKHIFPRLFETFLNFIEFITKLQVSITRKSTEQTDKSDSFSTLGNILGENKTRIFILKKKVSFLLNLSETLNAIRSVTDCEFKLQTLPSAISGDKISRFSSLPFQKTFLLRQSRQKKTFYGRNKNGLKFWWLLLNY